MPAGFSDPARLVERNAFVRLIEAATGRNDQSRPRLKGRVIDAVTAKPVSGAFIAADGQAVMTDVDGRFDIDFPELHGSSVLLLAAADNYQSLELKKNLQTSAEAVLRLRPQKSLPVNR